MSVDIMGWLIGVIRVIGVIGVIRVIGVIAAIYEDWNW